ncbi:hypothetical protein [Catellatospora sp. NPDC049609]|uniref:hypothetical protein n=1 Tax=Catellatospora sp. NPDC049609 TaxID=3155505 RepID=UPI00343214AD
MSHDLADGDDPELAQLRHLVGQARAFAATGEHAELTRLATVIWRRVHDPLLALTLDTYDVLVEVDALYDAAFPPPASFGPAAPEDRFRQVADVLDVPWPTPRRADLLACLVAGAGVDGLAEEAVAAPPSASRTRLLRLLVRSRQSRPLRRTVARVLEALYEADALDLDTVEDAFTAENAPSDGERLSDVLFGENAERGARAGADFLVALRAQFDEMVWRLTAAPNPDDWFAIPQSPKPRGLRFVLRGLDVWAGRLPAAPGTVDEDYYRRKLIAHLCAAELSGDESTELAELLRHRPEEERKVAVLGRPSLAAGEGPDGDPPRLAPTSADPVGDALAAAGDVVPRDPGDDIVLDDLRHIVRAHAIDPAKWDGRNTQLWFDDDCARYADVGRDGLALALADQPGIAEVDHMDREVVLVRTALSLPDAQAAGIRALLEINRRPRELPDDGRVSEETVSRLANGAASLLAEHGFAGRLRMLTADGKTWGVDAFYRPCEERLVQVLRVSAGFGGLGDGTRLEGTVEVHLTLMDFSAADPAESVALVGDRDFPRGGTLVASRDRHAVPPEADALARVLVEECLPWFDTVDSRDVIVAGWVRDPGSQPPYPLWEKLEVAARWGRRDEAAALLRYGNRMQPQHGPKFAAVAEKYRL